jgi:hypothetical protein
MLKLKERRACRNMRGERRTERMQENERRRRAWKNVRSEGEQAETREER